VWGIQNEDLASGIKFYLRSIRDRAAILNTIGCAGVKTLKLLTTARGFS
jgi:hypothetical protein